MNLYEFVGGPQHFLVFINLSDIINASIACTSQLLTTTLVTLGNTRVKMQVVKYVLIIIDATNKNI